MPHPTTTARDRLKYEDIHAILAETCDGLEVREETRARIMHPPRKINEMVLIRALQTAYQWGLAAAYASLPNDEQPQQQPPTEETTPERPSQPFLEPDFQPHWQDRWTNDSGL